MTDQQKAAAKKRKSSRDNVMFAAQRWAKCAEGGCVKCRPALRRAVAELAKAARRPQ